MLLLTFWALLRVFLRLKIDIVVFGSCPHAEAYSDYHMILIHLEVRGKMHSLGHPGVHISMQ